MGHERSERRERNALAGELLADTRHECNNQLAYVISNLQNLVEYADDMARVVTAYRAKLAPADLLDAEIVRLETESELDFVLDDAGRAAREGLAGAWRLRDILRTLERLSGEVALEGATVDLARLVKELVGLMGKAIALRATLTLDADTEAMVAVGRTQLTHVVVAMVKHALAGLDPRERQSNRIRIAVERREGGVALVIEQVGAQLTADAHGLERLEHAARDLGATLAVDASRTTLRLSHP